MKSKRYQRRFYRDTLNTRNLHILHYLEKETDLYILSDKALNESFIAAQVRTLRSAIESYIRKEPGFAHALKPIPVELRAPAVVRLMSRSASCAGVGPMAAVAGAIAELLGRALIKKGCREVIIENGGDIFLKLQVARRVGFYAGRGKFVNKLALFIRPEDTPMGICTSSATLGHSLSFGSADSVTVLAKHASIADAVATATCNRVRTAKDIKAALNFCRSIRGIRGAVIVMKNKLATFGKIEFYRRG